jgi:hypothetical protein
MDDTLVFAITLEDLQMKALEKMSRTLSDDEISTAKKGLEWGLLTGIDTVYNTLFFDMLENN